MNWPLVMNLLFLCGSLFFVCGTTIGLLIAMKVLG